MYIKSAKINESNTTIQKSSYVYGNTPALSYGSTQDNTFASIISVNSKIEPSNYTAIRSMISSIASYYGQATGVPSYVQRGAFGDDFFLKITSSRYATSARMASHFWGRRRVVQLGEFPDGSIGIRNTVLYSANYDHAYSSSIVNQLYTSSAEQYGVRLWNKNNETLLSSSYGLRYQGDALLYNEDGSSSIVTYNRMRVLDHGAHPFAKTIGSDKFYGITGNSAEVFLPQFDGFYIDEYNAAFLNMYFDPEDKKLYLKKDIDGIENYSLSGGTLSGNVYMHKIGYDANGYPVRTNYTLSGAYTFSTSNPMLQLQPDHPNPERFSDYNYPENYGCNREEDILLDLYLRDQNYFQRSDGKYPAIISVGDYDIYVFAAELNRKHNEIFDSSNQYFAALLASLGSPAAVNEKLSYQERLVEAFGLKDGFDKSFNKYPGVFTDVSLGFGFYDGNSLSKEGGYKKRSELYEAFDKIRESSRGGSPIHNITNDEIVSKYFTLDRVENRMATKAENTTEQIDGVSPTPNDWALVYNGQSYVYDFYTKWELPMSWYHLKYDDNFFKDPIYLVCIYASLYIYTNYDRPCRWDGPLLKLITLVLLIVYPPAALFTVTGAIWLLTLLVTLDIGGKDEQRYMRAILVVLAFYYATTLFQNQTATTAQQAQAAHKSGMYTVSGSSGAYTLAPTAKAYAYGVAGITSSTISGIGLMNEIKSEDEYEKQKEKERIQEEEQDKLDKELNDRENRKMILSYNHDKLIFDYDKIFKGSENYFDKQDKKKGDIYGSYNKIYN